MWEPPVERSGTGDFFIVPPNLREGWQLVDCVVLVAVGITHSGHRRVLGVYVALSKAEVHWRAFLDSLVRRGLKGVKMIFADAHAGLNAAPRATLPRVPWQGSATFFL